MMRGYKTKEVKVEIADEDKNIPALFPQVWLYYDPKLAADRIRQIFEHQRMDFLMLFSDCRRIVIELDGIQHYGEKKMISGRQYPDYLASVDKYAGMVSAQRNLTLAGYEVYRFGGKELNDETTGSYYSRFDENKKYDFLINHLRKQ